VTYTGDMRGPSPNARPRVASTDPAGLYLDDVATSLAPDADTTASEVSALRYSYTIGSAR
jgi:hypothetical protein